VRFSAKDPLNSAFLDGGVLHRSHALYYPATHPARTLTVSAVCGTRPLLPCDSPSTHTDGERGVRDTRGVSTSRVKSTRLPLTRGHQMHHTVF
jgi:hypothetical protein